MDKLRYLYIQIEDQHDQIEDLKETIRTQQRKIEFQNARLRELGFMSAHHFNGRLNEVLRISDSKVSLN